MRNLRPRSIAVSSTGPGAIPTQRRPTLLIADDHPLMLEGLCRLLEPDFEVVGTAASGQALLDLAPQLRPDLVISDISMPGIDGLEVARRLRAALPGTRILILSIQAEPTWVRAAFEAGASGYLTKTSPPEEIVAALRAVLQGLSYVSRVADGAGAGFAIPEPALPTHPAAGPSPVAGEPLTPRELEIVGLVGKGLANKEIARQLGVSVTTIRSHLSNIYDKLGPGSRVELALYAAHTGEAVM